MKLIKPLLLFLTLLLLMFATSCIDDNEEVNNPSPENVLTLDSNLVNLLLNVAINDGSFDNIIDNASCISLELPVTVIIDETEIVVNSETDFDAIEAIFDMFQTDDDTLEIVFPITVILSDYTQVVINSAEELAGYVAECFGENEDDDDIECIDFQYPIVFSTYDSNFQIIDTVSIENDEALYAFINNLEAGVLASLNFPVTLELANGETIEVNNNEELETAISEAEDDCDEDDDNDWNDDDYDCSLETINELLLNCTFETTIYNENDELIDTYQLDFNIENELIVNGEITVTDEAFWTLTEVESGYQIHIEDTPNFNLIDGDWIIESCAEDQLIMNQQTDSGNRKAVLEQECDDNCTLESISNNLKECLWVVEEFENYESLTVFTFNFEENNQLFSFPSYGSDGSTTWEMSTSSNGFPEIVISNFTNDIIQGSWIVIECNDGSYVLEKGEDVMVISRSCDLENNSLLDCYAYYVESQECDDDNDGVATFVIETNNPQTQECIDLYPLLGSLYPTYIDALHGVNGLNVSVGTYELESQTMYGRFYREASHEYAIQELQIVVESCENPFECYSESFNVIVYCDEQATSNQGFPIYDLTQSFMECDSEGFLISYYESEANALSGNNPISDAEYYANGSAGEGFFVRVELENNSEEFEIFMISLAECTSLFECYNDSPNQSVACDEEGTSTIGIPVYNLTQAFSECVSEDAFVNYFESEEEAIESVNQINNPSEYVNEAFLQTVYIRVELIYDPYSVVIYQIDLEDCNNPFDCFEEDKYVFSCDYNNNGSIEFYLVRSEEELYSCSPSNEYVFSYYVSQADAEVDINQIATPNSFENTMNLSVVYERAVYLGTGEYQIFPIFLSESSSCPNFDCVEADIVSSLETCHWVITDYTSYDNSTDYSNYAITFNQNGTLIIISEDGSEATGGNWSTQTTAVGQVYLTISSTSIPNISFLNDTFRFIECVDNIHFVLADNSNFLNEVTLNQDCL